MERRQKQRVEEMRETQKKDEENLNIKERFRVEVRKELYRLEVTCINMASLLRGLGIHVEGGFQPLPNQPPILLLLKIVIQKPELMALHFEICILP
eukprot:XP_024449270.1 uncharacterized protein LOC112326161 isoform X2 [Populus trichocarpa]